MQFVDDPHAESAGRHIRANGKTAQKNVSQSAEQDCEAFPAAVFSQSA
jgi:hypothetical protein